MAKQLYATYRYEGAPTAYYNRVTGYVQDYYNGEVVR